MDPLISVIVPIYNTEQYLVKCVNSIIDQTYKNLEIFLVDDGSTDSCPQLCDDFALQDSRIKVLHKVNGGQGSARNMALDIAQGEYISFVDSDDWIKPDMYRAMIEAILTWHADLAICGICTFNSIKYTDHQDYPETKVFNNTELMKAYISTAHIHTGPCNKLYHKNLFQDIRFPEIRAREDAYIMHELLGKAGCTVHIGKCMYIQLVRANSTEQAKFNLNKMSLLDSAKRLQEYIQSNYPEFYPDVAFKHVDEQLVLMCDIVSSFCYKKHKNLYKKLQQDILIEMGSLSQTGYSHHIKFVELNSVCNNFRKFKMKCYYGGVLKKLKEIYKKCLHAKG